MKDGDRLRLLMRTTHCFASIWIKHRSQERWCKNLNKWLGWQTINKVEGMCRWNDYFEKLFNVNEERQVQLTTLGTGATVRRASERMNWYQSVKKKWQMCWHTWNMGKLRDCMMQVFRWLKTLIKRWERLRRLFMLPRKEGTGRLEEGLCCTDL